MSGTIDAYAERVQAYMHGRWCGECRWGVVEEPPCCFQPGDRLPAPAVVDPEGEDNRHG